ncbi:cell wall surface anchor family protein [Lachnospiraceae bacterium KM106-2]|nr:cell wall surface anchor family protein [Lachnospiraceae bacterium KM106-2]
MKRKTVNYIYSLLLLFGILLSANIASADTINLTVNNNGDRTTATIQTYLDQAKENPHNYYKIKVPKGTYEIERCMRIYSNTYLDITGSTFKITGHPSDGYMLQVGDPKRETAKVGDWNNTRSKPYSWGKYSRGKNITIVGGTFDSGTTVNPNDGVGDMFTFSHVQNITLKNITFKSRPKKTAGFHMIEFAAAKNVKILNCTFDGTQKCRSAVQLESAIKGVANMNSQLPSDGTKSSNITVQGCKFKNMEYAFGTNHGTPKETFNNITVKNNTFEKITKYAVCVYNYKNCKIQGNTLKKSRSSSFDSMVLKLGTKNSLKVSKNKAK